MAKNKIISVLEPHKNAIRYLKGVVENDILKVLAYEDLPLDKQGGQDDGRQYGEAVKSAVIALSAKHKIDNSYLMVILPKYQVFARRVALPKCKDEEIRDMLYFEAQKHLPFSSEEAIIDFSWISEPGKEGLSEIMMYAVKKQVVNKLTETINEAGLFPRKIVAATMALSELMRYIEIPGMGNYSVIDLDDDYWEMEFFVEGKLSLSRGMAIKNESSDTLKTVADEMGKSFSSFHASYRDQIIKKAFVAGFDKFGVSGAVGRMIPGAEISNAFIPDGRVDLAGANSKVAGESIARLLGALLLCDKSQNLMSPEAISGIGRKKYVRTVVKAISLCVLAAVVLSGGYIYKNRASLAEGRRIKHLVNESGGEIAELGQKEAVLKLIEQYSDNSDFSLVMLQELNALIPGNVYVTQLVYDYEQKMLILKCRTNSFDATAKTAELLSKSKLFSGVNSKGARAAKFDDKNLVDFEIECGLAIGKGKSKSGAI
ncbi:MAG: hypothetical protein A2204_00115 [Elusimicrobia bacterium RIFOXYA1_FULL_47_7]|nr:MAG: hypothetical protein A2204_00115 [Elusimicrobia bacterium RIFOXYA1_FULL_47_7]OGS15749.1 MAG: hypothetical protein A2251_08685 [Elusimicrobia bacterium RIFOXYA2_FULL_47_53]OGS31050.1 MAG: hypothetical protein A2323_07005 [Elusimicrobia bacterium RIFOXYB2_FULL_46_23]